MRHTGWHGTGILSLCVEWQMRQESFSPALLFCSSNEDSLSWQNVFEFVHSYNGGTHFQYFMGDGAKSIMKAWSEVTHTFSLLKISIFIIKQQQMHYCKFHNKCIIAFIVKKIFICCEFLTKHMKTFTFYFFSFINFTWVLIMGFIIFVPFQNLNHKLYNL